MQNKSTTEKDFQNHIADFLCSPEGGWERCPDCDPRYRSKYGMSCEVFLDFIKKSQKSEWEKYCKACFGNPEEQLCQDFDDWVSENGLIDTLKDSFQTKGCKFSIFFSRPASALNKESVAQYKENICHCVCEWEYSEKHGNRVDIMLAVNGIPLAGVELKNQLTGQTIGNAQWQWKTDRNPREPCFGFNRRTLLYLGLDLSHCCMATTLNGKSTEFIPLDRGSEGPGNPGGAGNCPCDDGELTSYVWKDILQKDAFLEILRDFVFLQIKVEDGIEKKTILFPRYHQLDVVRKLVSDVLKNGPGKNYLIQHSAGSGKSNSIAWLAYRLESLHDDKDKNVFETVVVVTDRRVLNHQLQETIDGIKTSIGNVVFIKDGDSSENLKTALETKSKIVVTTLQKFPYICDTIQKFSGRTYAVIVDEAHSSQSGKSAIDLGTALGDGEEKDLSQSAEQEGAAEQSREDTDDIAYKNIAAMGNHANLSFFAFTATPKKQTLERFGERMLDDSRKPFHTYSMRQAIEEGFIHDVLKNYWTYESIVQVMTIPGKENQEGDSGKMAHGISQAVSVNEKVISARTAVIVEKFLDVTEKKIGGKAKMMVVAASRKAAVLLFRAIRKELSERGRADIRVMVAFSGVVRVNGQECRESELNRDSKGNPIPETQTKDVFHEEGRILVVAEKFQTGYDEPMLHTMAVDKKLHGVKAVQTLSRLNRTRSGKEDTFVLDFANTADSIREAFHPFYEGTLLEKGTDPNQLYSIQKALRAAKIYDGDDVEGIYLLARNIQDDSLGAKIAGKLVKVVQRYEDLPSAPEDERGKFRLGARQFTKLYLRLALLMRLEDVALFKECLFLTYLGKFLTGKKVAEGPLNVERDLAVLLAELQERFQGSIGIRKGGSVSLPQPDVKPPPPLPDPQKTTLDEAVQAFNERYGNGLLEDKTELAKELLRRLLDNEELKKVLASEKNRKNFEDPFKKSFKSVCTSSLNDPLFEILFKDNELYKSMKSSLCEIVWQTARKR